MLSSRIYPCGGEIEPLQKVENRYMEQCGVSEGFNPSEDFESAHDKAWCQAVDTYMFWKSVAEQCGCLTPHDCLTSMVIGLENLLITCKLEGNILSRLILTWRSQAVVGFIGMLAT